MEVLHLFPTDIYFSETDIDNKNISRIILKKEKEEQTIFNTNSGGWQSDQWLHQDKRFSKIISTLENKFKQIFNDNNYTDDLVVGIDSMWANVNRYRDSNLPHTHDPSDWSFVYYVKIPEDSGNLVMCDPRIRKGSKWGIQNFYKKITNHFAADLFTLPPVLGRLIIFPSYLEHYVTENKTDKPRISISGNIKMEKP